MQKDDHARHLGGLWILYELARRQPLLEEWANAPYHYSTTQQRTTSSDSSPVTDHRSTDPAPDWKFASEDARAEPRPPPADRRDGRMTESARNWPPPHRREAVHLSAAWPPAPDGSLLASQGIGYGVSESAWRPAGLTKPSVPVCRSDPMTNDGGRSTNGRTGPSAHAGRSDWIGHRGIWATGGRTRLSVTVCHSKCVAHGGVGAPGGRTGPWGTSAEQIRAVNGIRQTAPRGKPRFNAAHFTAAADSNAHGCWIPRLQV